MKDICYLSPLFSIYIFWLPSRLRPDFQMLFGFTFFDISHVIKLFNHWLLTKRIPFMLIPLLANQDLTPMHMQLCVACFH